MLKIFIYNKAPPPEKSREGEKKTRFLTLFLLLSAPVMFSSFFSKDKLKLKCEDI